MEYEIINGPSNAVLTATLDDSEKIEAKTGAMVSRSGSMNAAAQIGGGDGIKGMLSRIISDEREMVSNAFMVDADGAHITLAPDMPGDIVAIDLVETGRINAQSESPLA